MVIEDRSKVVDGVGLHARYKDRVHTAVAVMGEDGKLVFKVEGQDEPTYSSLSTAALAVAPEAKAVNGWRFWTLASEPLAERKVAAPKAPKEPKAPKAKKEKDSTSTTPAPRRTSTRPNISKMKKQTIEGKTGFFCSACMDGFYIDGDHKVAPAECPKGHPRKMVDDLAPDADAVDLSETLDELTTVGDVVAEPAEA